jgi:AAA domain
MANADSTARIAQPTSNVNKDEVFGTWDDTTVQDKGWKILVYGDSGSGKTYFAGTFPDPLFLDLEDGMRSLLQLKRNIKRYPKNASQTITTLDEVKLFYQLVKKINPATAPFKTIVVDSLNELQILVLDNSIKSTQTTRIYDDQPTQGDYGKLARDMQTLVRLFIKLPYNIVFIAGAKEREFAEDKILPAFLGKKTGPDVRRIIEQVGYCYTKQAAKDQPAEHMIAFGDTPAFIAKDRTGKLARPIANTYEAMMNVVNRGKE